MSVEFLAGTSSAANLVREIFRAADEHVRELGEQDLLSAVVSRIKPGEVGPVRQTDLKNALSTLVRSQQQGFRAEDMHQRFTAEVLLDVCRRWIVGETLSQTEKRYLRVSGRLATASLMIRVMTELFALARQQGFFKGVMLCLDEVEALFFSGVSASRIQAFLQDLRYLFDEAHGQHSGYSLLVVAGSTSRGAQDLREYNYPLFQRLGFDTETRIQLHEVKDLDEARSFAEVYIEFERQRYNTEKKSQVSAERARSLITDDDLKSALLGDLKSGDTRNQARLLEGLHRIIEAKKAAAK
ncbi:BREX system ATP-binding domain-containing protein [Mesorhizobium sp. M7A.F.Ca.US.011.01.1.1]|uniref:BREX system ATP-binding domain-containing protein n=1 Tax=Mesorhizobium sp. M7A.F.Ca.US.011.01.1.1 TaxID=2496741 RepID=UPI0013E37ED8|nr:BREX system ATP-binding domain-containing protein [Mesorhizobium sp. M7A.F.Ca.US.011.01.1.1]